MPYSGDTRRNIAIVSTCSEDWGGSEELWSRSVPFLQAVGFNVIVFKSQINKSHPEFIKLAQNDVQLIDLKPPGLPKYKRIYNRMILIGRRVYLKIGLTSSKQKNEESFFIKNALGYNLELVLISQGINFDGTDFAYQCFVHTIPYVMVSQKAVDFYWPQAIDRPYMVQAFQNAKKLFFVSHHNQRLTEEQFGTRFPNSQVIFNPVKLTRGGIPYPSVADGYRLACIGRLFLLDKGQDILLRILAQKKWMDRPLTVSFIGKGIDRDGLVEMAKFLNISKVEFVGHIDDVETLWANYHALILPSRSEGLPLSMVEAMAAGRPVIITKAGGNAELVEEGHTGFIGQANEESFDEAMERAWINRENWEEIGKRASAYVSKTIPELPEKEFAKHLTEIINGQ